MELSDGAKTALSKVVESSAAVLADALDSSGKMVKDNVKELAGEVILFKGIIDGGMSMFYSGLCFTIVGKAISFLYNIELEKGDSGARYFIISVLAVVLFFLGMWFCTSILQIIKAKYAPRLFLTEYAVELLKKDSNSSSKK